MRILIVGEPNDVYLSNYVKYVLMNHGFETCITLNAKCKSSYMNFYKENGISFISTNPELGFFGKTPIARSILARLYYHLVLIPLINSKKFDYVHVHTMHGSYLRMVHRINKRVKLICTYWGSDLYRYPETGAIALACLQRAESIVMAHDGMIRAFEDLFGNDFDGKLRKIKFGVNGYEFIDQVQAAMTKDECKAHLGLPPDCVVISVGYNAERDQHHFEVLNSLNRISTKDKERIAIVLQMTYGDSSGDYRTELSNTINNMSFRNLILSDYMTDRDVACLRSATDIFIHAQTTDAFSATVQEYLYAGAAVLNPVWIQYKDLVDNCIDLFEYAQYDEILSIVEGLLQNAYVRRPGIKEKLRSLSAWDVVSEQWRSLYN